MLAQLLIAPVIETTSATTDAAPLVGFRVVLPVECRRDKSRQIGNGTTTLRRVSPVYCSSRSGEREGIFLPFKGKGTNARCRTGRRVSLDPQGPTRAGTV